MLSGFHPTVQQWFAERFGEATPPQVSGWPAIQAGKHTLIAAPTGSGKTLAAFLWAIDSLLREGPDLPDETRVLYVSPLKALSNDVQKNLEEPLRQLRDMNIFLPEVRVLVRTGDTPASARAAMGRKPPHILVTTPESLYILLTTVRGRAMLRTVRTVIIDEIHALTRDKRGSHLALSLERLEALVGVGRASCPPESLIEEPTGGQDARPTQAGFQRIGLSATQKPLEDVARFLVGVGRESELVNVGHRRALDLGVELPRSPLDAVCSHDHWEEIYERIAELINGHRTTLVFVNTRKLAERVAARLTSVLGPEQVTCHHGSLSRQMRLDAEQRLKQGKLRALVATASLELGIDIGDVDLAIQVGSSRSIATFLQRVGRAGHSLRRIPKGRLFPLTLDDLVEAAGLMHAIRSGELDRTPQPRAPLDILAQQIVAACVNDTWDEAELFATFRQAWPYRDLTRADFDAAAGLHLDGRRGLLHRDGVQGRLRARKAARIVAITSGGAIPDLADFQVLMEPEGTFVGTLNEDFAIESNKGDIFQLGNTSWRVLRVEPGIVRVADAKGQPPTLPFWLGEAPARTKELSAEVGAVREQGQREEWLIEECGLSPEAARQVAEYIRAGVEALGAPPTDKRIIIERFFDEAGGMQLVIHAPLGGRINRAWGLALRKRFCRGFGFELQAAANEEAIVISLGPQHSFALEQVFKFLHPNSAREVLTQALLDRPMFESRWRWNATRALLIQRMRNGKRVPAALIRMRADDLLVQSFPQAVACPENLPSGDLEVPMDHPLVRQTVEDCLHEAMDIDGFLEFLTELREDRIEKLTRDTTEPSAFARGILSGQPYTFLDDAPLEERRTQAVMARRVLDPKTADTLGALDADAVERVREEAWPRPESAEELHDALTWMGYVTLDEAAAWQPWIDELATARRVVRRGGCWMAAETPLAPTEILRGRLEALGPVFPDDARIADAADPRLLSAPSAEPATGHEDIVRAPPTRYVLGDRQFDPGAEGPYSPSESEASGGRPPAADSLAHLAATPDLKATQSAEGGQPPLDAPTLESLLLALETQGAILRTRFDGRPAWCERRLLARIQRYTLDRLRREIEPVSAGDFLRFLGCWQHIDAGYKLEGPRGVADVIQQLAGYEAPAAMWEASILPSRVRDYERKWLDELGQQGEIVWGRMWGSGAGAVRTTPICLLPREDLDTWIELAPPVSRASLSGAARDILDVLQGRGPLFSQEIQKAARLLPTHLEMGLAEMIGCGLITCDSFAGLRQLIVPPSRRRAPVKPIGRWSLLRRPPEAVFPLSAGEAGEQNVGWVERSETQQPARPSAVRPRAGLRSAQPSLHADFSPDQVEFVARQMLRRTGVVFRRTLLRERQPLPWGQLARVYRRLELRGEVRGGRFVAGFPGEQYALPEAVELLRKVRRQGTAAPLHVPASDPLNYRGILTPDARVPSSARALVAVG